MDDTNIYCDLKSLASQIPEVNGLFNLCLSRTWRDKKAVCNNGEHVGLRTYIRRAGIARGLLAGGKDSRGGEEDKNLSAALKNLLSICSSIGN